MEILKTMFVIILGLSIATACRGQNTASIVGTVSDTSSALIPAGAIKVTNVQTGYVRSAETGSDGAYVVNLLPLGTYSVEISKPGFETSIRTGISLSIGQVARIDFQLLVGSPTQLINVQAAEPLVDTTQASVSSLMDAKRMVELPLSGRSPASLLVLIPGVTQVSAGTSPNSLTIDVNIAGGRTSANNFLLDGSRFNSVELGDGNPFPPPDFLSEFRVTMDGYDTSMGLGSAAVVQAVTRSGTNQFHGSLWEFHRDNVLTAKTYFAPSTPFLVQNQFGGTVGGPIRKDKDFFFFGYQGTRIAQSALVNTAIPPTQAERNGDFSHSAGGVPTDPATGLPFPNAMIPSSRFDPAAVKYLSVVPLANTSAGTYSTLDPETNNGTNLIAKGDHRFTSNNMMSGRMWYSKGTGVTPNQNIPFGQGSLTAFFVNIELTDTYTFRPNLLNTASVSYNRKAWSQANSGTPFKNPMDAGVNIPNPVYPNNYPSKATVNGRFIAGPSLQGPLTLENVYEYADTVNWIKGKHDLKFGIEYMHTRFGPDFAGFDNGLFTFNGQYTGNALADFLLGRPNELEFLREREHNYFDHWGFFVNDNFRLNSKFTANAGLRWDYDEPVYGANGTDVNFVPGFRSTRFTNAPTGMAFAGDPGQPKGMVYPDHRNFAPRAGFVWDPFGNHKTLVRTGYGIFFQSLIQGDESFLTDNQPFLPVILNFNVYSFSDPLHGIAPGPVPGDPIETYNPKTGQAAFVLPVSMWADDQHNRTAYVQSYTLSIQHELTPNNLLELDYMGNGGRRLVGLLQINPAIYGPGATAANIEQRRLYNPGQISSVVDNRNGFNSSYNALAVVYTRRFTNNLLIRSNYTWSRSIDDTSVAESGSSFFQNPFDPQADKGLADFHREHVFAASWVWDLPALSHFSAVPRWIFGNWEASGLATVGSGLPFNIVTGGNNSLTAVGNDRPNLVGNARLPGGRSRPATVKEFFNTSAFVPNAIGQFGDVGRNMLTGPGYADVDFGMFKNIPLGEARSLQFRSEFFNLFNRPNFGQPVSSLSSPAFGQIQSTNNARQIQFGMKAIF